MLSLTTLLIGLNTPFSQEVTHFRIQIVDFFAPLFERATNSAYKSEVFLQKVKSLFSSQESEDLLDNLALEIETLKIEKKLLTYENQHLRKALKAIPLSEHFFITAEVIAEPTGGPYQNILINVGRQEGVKEDFIALAKQHVIGRVIEVGKKSARLLLLTDANSRIPVMAQDQKTFAILVGDNFKGGLLTHFNEEASFKIGDPLFTSGHGAIFPAGLPIGYIKNITKEKIEVAPFENLSHIHFIHLLSPSFQTHRKLE